MGKRPAAEYSLELGAWVLPPDQETYLEWLVTELPAGKKHAEYARMSGIPAERLSNWRNKDNIFKHAWRDRVESEVASPDTMRAHLDILDREGRKGDVQSIKLYWQLVEQLSPKALKPEALLSPDTMTDAQLAEELQREAKRLGADTDGT